MIDGLSSLAAWALTYGLHSTVLLCAAWLLTRRLSTRWAAWQETIWKTALFGGVVTATLSTLGAGPSIALPALAKAITAAPTPAAADPVSESRVRVEATTASEPPAPLFLVVDQRQVPLAVGTERRPLAGIGSVRSGISEGQVRWSGSRPMTLSFEVLSDGDLAATPLAGLGPQLRAVHPIEAIGAIDTIDTGSPTPAAESAVTAYRGRQALLVTALLWSLGALLGLVRWAGAWGGLRRGLATRQQLRGGPALQAFERLARKAGIRGVRLSVSDALSSPITIGWWQREVCLPRRALDELAPQDLENVLAHELAHAQRADPAWLAAGQVLERVLFFQPLQRLATRRLREAAEVLCDDQAVRWTGRRFGFARSLTEVASWVVDHRCPVPAMAAGTSDLRRRIEWLLDDDARLAPARGGRPAAWCALAMSLVLVPGVRAAQESQESQASPAEPSLALAPAPQVDATPSLPAPLPETAQPPKLQQPDLLERRRPRSATPAPTGAARAVAQGSLTARIASELERELALLRADAGELHRAVEGRAELDAVHDRILALEKHLTRLDEQHRGVLELLAQLDALGSR